MNTDNIGKITITFENAFHNLGVIVQANVLKSLVKLVQRAMTAEGRYYHTPDHALTLVDDADAIQTLAALFHDLVYYQADQGFCKEVWSIIKPYIARVSHDGATIWLVDEPQVDDLSYHLVGMVFGFSGGQELQPTIGSNEFLSALVMAKSLEGIVPNQVLIKVSACIEGSIPFRERDTYGIGPFERLNERVRRASRELKIPMSEEELLSTIQEAVIFANKDVANFKVEAPSLFLETTWKLLPEQNPALQKSGDYSIRDYRRALQGMDQFLSSINPEDVLHQYAGVPTQVEIDRKLVYIRRNLKVGSEYIKIKLMTLAILEALADVSGGDAPIALFIGDVDQSAISKGEIASFIPEGRIPAEKHYRRDDMEHLFSTGQIGLVDTTDVKTAPLALFIYQHSREQLVHSYLEAAYKMFDGSMKPAKFLQAVDPCMLATIAEACANVATSRRDKLMAYAKEKV